MTKAHLLKALWEHRSVAIIRTRDQQVAASAMEAAVRGGIRILEFTLTTPGALELIETFAGYRDVQGIDGLTSCIVGAGTVLTVDDVRSAALVGARFVVSPVTDPEVIAEANALGLVAIPGVHTPTEALAAHRAGAPLLKLFPAPAGGVDWVRALLAPLPFLRVFPTQGVTTENIPEWLEAGAWAVGLGQPLFRPEDLERRDWAAIEARAITMRGAAKGVVRGRPPEESDPWVEERATERER